MLTLTIKHIPPKHEALKDDRRIFINEFTIDSAAKFTKQFEELNADDEVTVIPITITSYGGEVTALLAMLDTISTATKPVATIGSGAAMSCAAVLLSAGTKGYRFASPDIEIMIHEISAGVRGSHSDIQNDAAQTKRLNHRFLRILANNSNKSLKYIKDKMKKSGNVDWYLDANEAKLLGIIDTIGIPLLVSTK